MWRLDATFSSSSQVGLQIGEPPELCSQVSPKPLTLHWEPVSSASSCLEAKPGLWVPSPKTMQGLVSMGPPGRAGKCRKYSGVPAGSACEEGVVLGEERLLYTKQMHHKLILPGTDTPGEMLPILPTHSSENNCTCYLPSFRNRTSAERWRTDGEMGFG